MSEYFPFSVESSKESDTEKSPESSKSKKKKSLEIGKQTVPAIIEAPKFEAGKKPEQADRIKELFSRRPFGEALPDDKAEKKDAKDDTVEESPEASEKEVALEELSTAESHEAVKRYVETQKDAIAADAEKLKEQDAEETQDTRTKAEDAADVALLDAVEEKLNADPDKSVEEAVTEAEAEVTERIESEADKAADEEGVEEAGADEPVEGADEVGPEGEVPLSDEADDEIVLHPTPAGGTPTGRAGSGSGGSGGGGGSGPPRGPFPGAPGGMPPFGPGSPGSGPAAGGRAGPNFNTAPTAPKVVEVQDITAERRAMAQGALAGLFVGYLVGRRKGRLKTEKRLMPIQRKLEKQVNQLYDSLATSEQSVRKLAREKSEAMAASKAAQQRFAERLAATSTTERRASMASAANRSSAPANSERAREHGRGERFTAGVLEAPAVVLAAAATLRAERKRETAPAVDFTKKIEAYSPQELDRAAEKIRIDGTTLKELARTHNLDERAVRRVVGRFIEGGNVKEALTHEMVEKELQYERDPKLRQAIHLGQVSGGGAADAGNNQHGTSPDDSAAPASGQTVAGGAGGTSSDGRKPSPDQATLAKLRKQQITQISVAATIVIVFAVIIVALLS